MPNFRRWKIPGARYFFTVVTHERKPWLREADTIAILQAAIEKVQSKLPFDLDGLVVLPDHLHCLWALPPDDDDFPTRWRLIKTFVTKAFDRKIHPFWQNRFWEHVIRDDRDFEQHCHYIHFNPVKHGHCARPRDWPHSSFMEFVEKGIYDEDWGTSIEPSFPPHIGGE